MNKKSCFLHFLIILIFFILMKTYSKNPKDDKNITQEFEAKKNENISYDSVTHATEVIFPEDEFEYYKRKLLEREKKALEKKEEREEAKTNIQESKINVQQEIIEKKEELEVKDKKKPELIEESEDKLFKPLEKKEEVSLNVIIFIEKDKERVPPSFNTYNDNFFISLEPWYSAKDFLPENLEDFYKARPDILVDENGVIKRSSLFINSKLGEELFNIAYSYYLHNEYMNATKIFEKLFYYNFRIPETAYYIAFCKLQFNRVNEAISYLKFAIDKATDFNYTNSLISDYYYCLGNFYFKIREYNLSLSSYLKSLELDEKNFKNYENIGSCFYILGDYNKALEYWKRGMEKGDNNCKDNYYWLLEKIK